MRTLLLAALALLLALPSAQALPTPGLFCDLSEPLTGRVFPEAMETNDYVGYYEAQCGLAKLMAEAPERIRIDVVGQSVGWGTITGGHDTFDVYVVRVSDYASAIPIEDKIRIVFQLSIHGNEKGGREGGLRVIEDFVRGIGHAEKYPELMDYLTYMEILFVFPNPDGWVHEETQYRANDACYFSLTCTPGKPGVETQNFVRVNGNGFDVNRQWPTVGWVREQYQPMSQPEAQNLVHYLQNETNIKYASDIHGMLNPADGTAPGIQCAFGQVPPDVMGFDPTCFANAVTGAKGHYVLTMLPGGRQDPGEMAATTSLAELVKERLNSDPYFAEWNALPNSLGGAWGGEYNDWGTVWDTIGYTDSGFTSDYYAQDQGLNAPGVDFELAYNHVTFDNYYPALAQRMNAYHVETVREIVRAFMDQANLDIQFSVDVKGTRTAYLDNPTVVTNAGAMTAAKWPAENPHDDGFDTAHRVIRAAPNDYFLDLKPVVADGDKPGILDALTPADLAAKLDTYTNLVIAGSAYKTIASDAAAQAAIKAWVEKGGNLVLTDEAMQLLVPLGLAKEGSVASTMAYAGATNFVDTAHPLAADIRGLARQTYEPVPLGFSLAELSAPVWAIDTTKTEFAGDVVGVAGRGQGSAPVAHLANFGTASLGSGKVSFLGALLPDPYLAPEAYYGVDAYATTYTGNQLLRNMLGWGVVFGSTPVATDALGKPAAAEGVDVNAAAGAQVPLPPIAWIVGALALVALLRRR